MTDLSTTNLKRLLDEATPGPWERNPANPKVLCNFERMFAVHVELTRNGAEPQPEDVTNTELIALAPQLAREVLRLRKELTNLQAEARYAELFHATELTAKQVFEALDTTISEILGDHDE